MPGFEVIGAEERAQVDEVFDRGGVLFRHGFDALRIRFCARKHTAASVLPRFRGKADSCILGFVGFVTMTQPLTTDNQRAQLLANGEARATWFLPASEPRSARKHWIAASLKPQGSLTVDDGALAAVAGMMYLLYYGLVDFFMGFVAGIKAFTAAVLGGIGSLPGAMLGGLLIGLIETFWSAYFSVEYKDVAAFSILIVVLIFMPTGLLGRPEVEKV